MLIPIASPVVNDSRNTSRRPRGRGSTATSRPWEVVPPTSASSSAVIPRASSAAAIASSTDPYTSTGCWLSPSLTTRAVAPPAARIQAMPRE